MDAGNDSQIEPEIAEYPEAGPFWVGLWAVARHWVALLAHIFEPDLLASPGITRSFALRCRNWLWPIEGLVRRLIIAAAMKLDAGHPPKPAAGRKHAARPHASSSVPFAVLPRVPGRQAHTAPHASRPQPEHRHIAFPGDDLLRLFPRHDRRNARPLCRRSCNPLHRRGRRSRWDPDYQGVAGDGLFMLPGRQVGLREDRAAGHGQRLRNRADRSSPYWKPHGDLPEWKRIDQEWERVIPARALGQRIKALVRVLEAPERWIARTARRLSADLAARVRELPPPRLKKPKLDRTPCGFLAEQLAQSHAFLDTS